MYRNIGGIQALEDGPGYKHFRIAVALDARLNFASASLKTYYGTIESKWEVHDQSFEHQVTVPANTSAEVVFPAGTAVTIREGGKALNGVTGISDISTGGDRIRITLASGTYHFSCALD
jgi:alpha-L-rhamnosidase